MQIENLRQKCIANLLLFGVKLKAKLLTNQEVALKSKVFQAPVKLFLSSDKNKSNVKEIIYF